MEKSNGVWLESLISRLSFFIRSFKKTVKLRLFNESDLNLIVGFMRFNRFMDRIFSLVLSLFIEATIFSAYKSVSFWWSRTKTSSNTALLKALTYTLLNEMSDLSAFDSSLVTVCTKTV